MQIYDSDPGLLVWSILIFVHLVLAMVALVDLVRRRGSTGSRIGWAACCILLPVAGPIVYLVWGRPRLSRFDETA